MSDTDKNQAFQDATEKFNDLIKYLYEKYRKTDITPHEIMAVIGLHTMGCLKTLYKDDETVLKIAVLSLIEANKFYKVKKDEQDR